MTAPWLVGLRARQALHPCQTLLDKVYQAPACQPSEQADWTAAAVSALSVVVYVTEQPVHVYNNIELSQCQIPQHDVSSIGERNHLGCRHQSVISSTIRIQTIDILWNISSPSSGPWEAREQPEPEAPRDCSWHAECVATPDRLLVVQLHHEMC